MTNIDLSPLLDIDGILAAALIDLDTALPMITAGEGVNMELAAVGNNEVCRAVSAMTERLVPDEGLDDIIISQKRHYHLIRPLRGHKEICLYLMLDRGRANIAMARYTLKMFELGFDYG